uniref:Secreted protein n=1 Tax=Panagrellus redivivus TaxID=6233 RepID=A0A7E4VCT6_PANRE
MGLANFTLCLALGLSLLFVADSIVESEDLPAAMVIVKKVIVKKRGAGSRKKKAGKTSTAKKVGSQNSHLSHVIDRPCPMCHRKILPQNKNEVQLVSGYFSPRAMHL